MEAGRGREWEGGQGSNWEGGDNQELSVTFSCSVLQSKTLVTVCDLV